jgi:hypothetical protein
LARHRSATKSTAPKPGCGSAHCPRLSLPKSCTGLGVVTENARAPSASAAASPAPSQKPTVASPRRWRTILAAADLLVRPGSAQDPLRGILQAARAGELDAKRLDKMLAAAQQQNADMYRQEVGTRAEGLLVEDFRRALADAAPTKS